MGQSLKQCVFARRRAARAKLVICVAVIAASQMGCPCRGEQTTSARRAARAQLKSLSLEDLGKLDVTSVSKQPEEVWRTPAAIYVLTHQDIVRSGATTIPDMLRLIPGVQVSQSQSDQWAVGIRGFDGQFSRGLLVLIDGRSVYTPLFQGVYWDVQDLPIDSIDRIEVIRGPGGSIWGPNAVNGVINIITRPAAETQGTDVHLDGGSAIEHFNGAVRQGFSPRPGVQVRMYAKGFDRGPELNPGHDPYDHWRQERGGFRADWKPDSSDKVMATGMIYGGRSGVENAIGVFTPPEQAVVDGTNRVSGGDVVLRWDRALNGGSNFYVQGYFDRTNRATPQFDETRDTWDLDFIGNIGALARQDLIVGAHLRESPSSVIQTQRTVDFEPHRQNDTFYSFFAQDAINFFNDNVTLTLGSKFENNNFSGWGAEPSARLLWHPTSRTTLWGAVSRGLRIPGRVDRDLTLIGNVIPSPPIFVAVHGNPNFKPEVLIGSEAGYRQLLTTKLYLDITAFHNQYDDLESYGGPIPLFTFPTRPYPYTSINVEYANGLKGVSDGVEIAPDWRPCSWWELRGSFSHLHMALHSKPGFSQASYAQMEEGSSPDRQASAQSVFSFPHEIEVVPDYRYVSALPAEPAKAWQTADAHVSWSFAKHYTLSMNGRNLLQPWHFEFAGDNSNPVGIRREYYAGLEWSR